MAKYLILQENHFIENRKKIYIFLHWICWKIKFCDMTWAWQINCQEELQNISFLWKNFPLFLMVFILQKKLLFLLFAQKEEKRQTKKCCICKYPASYHRIVWKSLSHNFGNLGQQTSLSPTIRGIDREKTSPTQIRCDCDCVTLPHIFPKKNIFIIHDYYYAGRVRTDTTTVWQISAY